MYFFPQSYFVANTVDFGYVNDESQGVDRIYAQYRNKEKAVRWYRIPVKLGTKISDVATLVRTSYNIDASYGAQLDVIGRIVGMSRTFVNNVQLYPGLFANPDGAEFGDPDSIFSAAFIDEDFDISDKLYRILIRSKIIKNNSDASIESILKSVNFLLPNAQVVRLVDNEDMSFSIEFYGQITELERWILLNVAVIPKPQGVFFNGFLEGYRYIQFGDDDVEFGDTSYEFVGFTEV